MRICSPKLIKLCATTKIKLEKFRMLFWKTVCVKTKSTKGRCFYTTITTVAVAAVVANSWVCIPVYKTTIIVCNHAVFLFVFVICEKYNVKKYILWFWVWWFLFMKFKTISFQAFMWNCVCKENYHPEKEICI